MASENITLTLKHTGKEFHISISPDATVAELKTRISAQAAIPVEGMRLLCSGRFLKDELPIAKQDVKLTPTSKILIVQKPTEDQKQEIKQQETAVNKLSMLETVAEKLAARTDEGENNNQYYFELENQYGQKIQLPEADRKALLIGMTLYEKGRKYLERVDYKSAIDLFKQADARFSQVSSDILSSVDNYGLLCLDLAWTYFKLQDITCLADAAWRVRKAQECLERCYGPNMERAKTLHGGAIPELPLFVRLHILQGVLAYYQRDYVSAHRWFDRADAKLKMVAVTDEELAPLIAMGFSASEARRALRATAKNADVAITYLLERREQLRKKHEEERKRRADRREQRRWGKTASGKWVDLELLKRLSGMGFQRKLVAEGLRQTDNHEEQTLNLLLNSMDVLRAAVTKREQPARKPPTPAEEEKLAQLVALGYERKLALGTLRLADGNVEQAVELLITGHDVDALGEEAQLMSESTRRVQAENSAAAEDPVATTTTTDEPMGTEAEAAAPMEVDENAERERRQRELESELEGELIRDVPGDEEAYLDMNLTDEMNVLAEYRMLLATAQQ